MEAYATVDDLQKRWRTLADSEIERAEALLVDASAIIASLLSSHGIEVDPDDETQADVLTAVTCNMVQRVMSVADDLMGVKQYSQTAGSYSGVYTFSNTSGDLYLTTLEKQLLGIKKQSLIAVRPAIHDGAGDEVAGW